MVDVASYLFYLQNPRGSRYYAVYPINEGGFGVVFSGVTSTGSGIAIKLIKPTQDIAREWESWLNEVNVCIKCLRHPNIVQIHDFFSTPDGHLIIVMEKALYALSDLIEVNYKISFREICRIGLQILLALDHIHHRNVIHRDVTPKNILVFPNLVYKLWDFGIAKQFITSDEILRTLIGYPSFIPPELLRINGYSSKQSDIYQLGLVLLTLLIGDYPIPRNLHLEETRAFISAGTPRQIAESLISAGGTKGKLASVLAVMLRRRDEYRYRSAIEVFDDLYSVIKTHELIQASIAAPKKRPWLR